MSCENRRALPLYGKVAAGDRGLPAAARKNLPGRSASPHHRCISAWPTMSKANRIDPIPRIPKEVLRRILPSENPFVTDADGMIGRLNELSSKLPRRYGWRYRTVEGYESWRWQRLPPLQEDRRHTGQKPCPLTCLYWQDQLGNSGSVFDYEYAADRRSRPKLRMGARPRRMRSAPVCWRARLWRPRPRSLMLAPHSECDDHWDDHGWKAGFDP